ncbi:alpha/beta fold hydrolase [Halapricum sp. CBA1109]|uniref:alpha/beta fold hydrolase n=1 Tax=Halapricum sp. CBA1109 TaxID=2668068 RepID=UPI0012FB4ABD|nr:alpha/beta hydrolase [Halapricum sp. CBA1109]MUV90397.1 alpha/beta fold hydrolase [Halapricum sp. CBA1109]
MESVTSADGTRIAYERHGEGPPLILLYGGGGRRFWDPIVPAFTDDYTVVVPDRRVHDADASVEGYIQREVSDAEAVADAVDGDPILFGHSFGGRKAIETAAEVDVAAAVAYEPAYLVGEYREQADLAARMQERLDAGDPRGAMKLHLKEVIHGGDVEHFEAWLDAWEGWPEAAEEAEHAVRMDRALEQHPLADGLAIDAPALLLAGSEGPSHLRDSIRAVHERLDGSRFVEFDGLGHLGPVEDPDRVIEAVRSFLETHPDLKP